MDWLQQQIRDAQHGDRLAFGELVRRFQDMAVGYAYAILRDLPLAEDAAQEAFLEAQRALPQLREANAFPAWLRRIVFKQCDRLTRGKQPQMVALTDTLAVAAADQLHFAATAPVAAYLLTQGADVAANDDRGRTPLLRMLVTRNLTQHL